MKKIEFKYQIPGFVIVLIIAFFAFKFGKPYIQHERLEYYVQDQIDYTKSPFQIKPDAWDVNDRIRFKAQQLGLPIQQQQILIDEIDDLLEVSIKYTYIVDLHFREVPLDFQCLLRTER